MDFFCFSLPAAFGFLSLLYLGNGRGSPVTPIACDIFHYPLRTVAINTMDSASRFAATPPPLLCPLFNLCLFFFLLHIYLHLNLFFLVAFVEVAIMSVVRGGRQQQQTIWNVDTSFSLVIISVFFIFQGWKRDVKDMVL